MNAHLSRLKSEKRKALDDSRRRTRPEEKNMDPEEWETLCLKVRDRRYLLYFDFLQSLGLRAHEGLILKPTDFNFEKGVVNITPLKRDDDYSVLFPIRPDLCERLRRTEYPYFPFQYEAALRIFKRASAEAKLNPRLALHSLRHLCATRLTLIQTSDFERVYFMRHKPKGMTNRYGFVPMARLRQISEELWKGQTWIWKETPHV